jgi:ATP-binding cassette, subfamily B, bacterial
MAESASTQHIFANPVKRIFNVIKLEKNEISSIYFYAILSGLIQLIMPLGIQSIISFVLGGAISTSLVIMIFLVVLSVFLNGLLQVNQMRIIEKVQQKLFVRYSFEFANRLPKINLQSVDSYYLPELVNRFFDTVALQKGISKLLLDIPGATIQIFFGLILLSFYHPIFIFFGFILLLTIFLILRITSSKGMESSLRESDYKYGVAAWLQELARVVVSFKFSKNKTLNIEKTDALVSGYLTHRTVHFRVLLFQYWSLVGFKIAITAAMLIVGSILLIDQQLNIGQFIAAEIVILMVIGSIEKLISNLDTVYDVLTSVEKLAKLTDKPLEDDGAFKLEENQNEGIAITLQNVSFNYNEHDEKTILNNISLKINSGEKVCIIGPTGSGKSSLLGLISGVYKKYEGNILYNNLPLGNYQSDSIRAATGVLLSNQDIFRGTLLENINMGCKEITPQHIMQLADKIGLKTFMEGLKIGFETELDPLGKRLSTNVIQKILLLRAMVNHPRLLLMEQPFENISKDVKLSLENYLFSKANSQTIIISCNEQEIAERCDKVIVMHNGTIAHIGTWAEVKLKIK